MIGLAFVLRELLQRILLSSIAGLVVDSLDFLAGQIIGKAWMVLFAMPIVAWLRNRDRRVSVSA
jgi:queuosine precursor transporter